MIGAVVLTCPQQPHARSARIALLHSVCLIIHAEQSGLQREAGEFLPDAKTEQRMRQRHIFLRLNSPPQLLACAPQSNLSHMFLSDTETVAEIESHYSVS